MKRWQFVVRAVLLTAILIVQLIPIVSSSRAQPTWEYTIRELPDESFERDINRAGDVGWEMVCSSCVVRRAR